MPPPPLSRSRESPSFSSSSSSLGYFPPFPSFLDDNGGYRASDGRERNYYGIYQLSIKFLGNVRWRCQSLANSPTSLRSGMQSPPFPFPSTIPERCTVKYPPPPPLLPADSRRHINSAAGGRGRRRRLLSLGSDGRIN